MNDDKFGISENNNLRIKLSENSNKNKENIFMD
jgi:hypothetical protein